MSDNIYAKRGVRLSFVAEKHGDADPQLNISYIDPSSNQLVVCAEDVVISSEDRENPTVVTIYPIARGHIDMILRFTNDFYNEDGDRNIRLTNIEVEHDLDTSPTTYLPYIWNMYEFDGLAIYPDETAGDGFQDIILTHTADAIIEVDFVMLTRPTLDMHEINIDGTDSVAAFTFSTDKTDNRLTVNGEETEDYTIVDANTIRYTYPGSEASLKSIEFCALRNF